MAGSRNERRKRRWIALATVAVATVLAGALHLSPASAQPLPWFACSGYIPGSDTNLKYCISNDNGNLRAGALNFNTETRWDFAGKVELSYHGFGDPGPNRGGRIIAWSDELYGLIPARGNLSTFIIPSWLPGIYCARLYMPRSGYWRDMFCVDTNGNQWVP